MARRSKTGSRQPTDSAPPAGGKEQPEQDSGQDEGAQGPFARPKEDRWKVTDNDTQTMTGNPVTDPTPGVTGAGDPQGRTQSQGTAQAAQNQNDAPKPQGDTQPSGSQPSDGTPSKTFTQEEMDSIIGQRIKAERQKYADYDTIKAQAAKLQEIEDAQKTEDEKRQERLTQLERELEQTRTVSRQATLRSAVVAEAARQNFTDPADAMRLLDVDGLTVGEDGAIEGLDEALKDLAKSKPYLLKRTQAQVEPANPARQPTGRTDDDRRRRYFGGGGTNFFAGGGVVQAEE